MRRRRDKRLTRWLEPKTGPISGSDADTQDAGRLNGVGTQYTAIWSVGGTVQTRDANFGRADGTPLPLGGLPVSRA